ncbi:UDP-3-O-[3-hydroxymyristoyl] N-acetylglucosamine deacetylase [Thioclava sp. L04-15]|uniref:UDP-3-O-acyl-N-acetylglucosamine deacetylase n=1 Tax=Thioclava sp. L04-15 TaxID=1915318 RepID=UPI0009967E98|nr:MULTISPECIES: UDP-3-O-acyl-N-acetylglucosamine deacetylase [unclassified Thioclava]MBD3802519.1 UDP-3-O-acyl-N-acetylglucosamine deacetylase [Thioclava sp.]OOY27362.1 UDP-3-O-[3-hydroxymyristoyl] N-acetylglucosamine deacetylase [Thioclava sp. L04-15]TNE83465.1 MAG: UDP-3-O-acyl-N-acetylglucosamine deacetylase [Paracoccaceae bacterium]
MQTTLAKSVAFSGVGLHSGAPVEMHVHPAPAGHGIVFRRTDVTGVNPRVPALWDKVPNATLCTLIENEDGVQVSTIEHLMAALVGAGIHNALIELNAGEVPILDGSSAPFVAAFCEAGLRQLAGELRAIRILKPVEVRNGAAVARLEPAASLEIDFRIDFTDAAIGQQSKRLKMANGAFVRELMDSRTFCRLADVDAMQEHGLALGGTFENAVVVDGDKVLSPGGLRHADEPVRHKMLDALGDLALAGAPILGRYRGNRAGHAMTNNLLRALFERPDAWCWETCSPAQAYSLPGAGVCRAEVMVSA